MALTNIVAVFEHVTAGNPLSVNDQGELIPGGRKEGSAPQEVTSQECQKILDAIRRLMVNGQEMDVLGPLLSRSLIIVDRAATPQSLPQRSPQTLNLTAADKVRTTSGKKPAALPRPAHLAGLVSASPSPSPSPSRKPAPVYVNLPQPSSPASHTRAGSLRVESKPLASHARAGSLRDESRPTASHARAESLREPPSPLPRHEPQVASVVDPADVELVVNVEFSSAGFQQATVPSGAPDPGSTPAGPVAATYRQQGVLPPTPVSAGKRDAFQNAATATNRALSPIAVAARNQRDLQRRQDVVRASSAAGLAPEVPTESSIGPKEFEFVRNAQCADDIRGCIAEKDHDKFNEAFCGAIRGFMGKEKYDALDADLQENRHLRYGGSVGYAQHSAITLENQAELQPNEQISANDMKGMGGWTSGISIASQAPTETNLPTWRNMLVEHNIDTIIDLTNELDPLICVKRGQPELFFYSSERKHGFHPKAVHDSPMEGVQLKQLSLGKGLFAKGHVISHFHFDQWPDKKVPKLDQFGRLIDAINGMQKNSKGGLLIHCVGGMDRTATAFTGLELKRMAVSGEMTRHNYAAKLMDAVIQGREHRNVRMFVQTSDQLNLLYEYAKQLVGV